jgi:tetraacyldisaccharide 4'-kinase
MPSVESFHRGLIDGSRQGWVAGALRGLLCAMEPAYAAATGCRNALFTNGYFASARAARPVISVGNITTGGTGKTPVVQWLCAALQARGYRPAVLMRGYKAAAGERGDEQRLLEAHLPGVTIHANPSRVAGAAEVIARTPDVGVLVLDDGFQHRKLRRDFDLVLIDASNPFGFGHVLPRGLLREPLTGLERASAVLLTHCELVDSARLDAIQTRLRSLAPQAPTYRSEHHHTHLADRQGDHIPLEHLRHRRTMTLCAIGNPGAFEQQVALRGAEIVDTVRFADHHHYTVADLEHLAQLARHHRADLLVTTGKDWVKLCDLPYQSIDLPPIARMEMSIRFAENDETKLMEQILATVRTSPAGG